MKYELEFTDTAKKDLKALPDWLQRPTLLHALRLAKSPSTESRRVASPPYAPGGMMSEFRHPVGNTVHRVVLFFKYTPDETALRIFGIGYTALLTDDPDWKPPVDNA
jgi:hypothetical protein